MTSWKKRIGNVTPVLKSILNQSKRSDRIILNLSSSEFAEKDKELPKELLDLVEKESCIEINWIDGENTRQWKKTIPTLMKFPTEWVLCIDDDRLYGYNFIENIWNAHLLYPDSPITVNRSYRVHGNIQHCGHGTLEKGEFYKCFEGVNFDELYKMASSDTFFTYMLAKNGKNYVSCVRDDSHTYNSVFPLTRSEGTCSSSKHFEMWNFLTTRYGAVSGSMRSIVANLPKDAENYADDLYSEYRREPVQRVRKKIRVNKVIRRIK